MLKILDCLQIHVLIACISAVYIYFFNVTSNETLFNVICSYSGICWCYCRLLFCIFCTLFIKCKLLNCDRMQTDRQIRLPFVGDACFFHDFVCVRWTVSAVCVCDEHISSKIFFHENLPLNAILYTRLMD